MLLKVMFKTHNPNLNTSGEFTFKTHNPNLNTSEELTSKCN